jgi:hypothetical protein
MMIFGKSNRSGRSYLVTVLIANLRYIFPLLKKEKVT